MSRSFFLIIPILLFGSSCINHEDDGQEENDFYKKVDVEIKYAEGFSVDVSDQHTTIQTFSIGDNTAFEDKIYLPHKKSDLSNEAKILDAKMSSVVCQSSTHLAFIEQLNSLQNVRGLCGMKYVSDPETVEKLKKNGVEEICNGEQIVTEKLLKVKPDLFLIYPFGKTFEKNFESSGVQTFLIAEYLEESQLARLEWIKLFGLILGKADEANEYFNRVEKEYRKLKKDKKDGNKTFIMNLPFGDSWFMPSSKSVGVQLMEDAGLKYYYADKSGTENMSRSKEEVWSDGTKADYWIIIAERPKGFRMNDLLAEEEVYREFKSVKNKNVIFCNTNEVDYFAQGVVEPHILLKDLLFLTDQLKEHDPKYFRNLE